MNRKLMELERVLDVSLDTDFTSFASMKVMKIIFDRLYHGHFDSGVRGLSHDTCRQLIGMIDVQVTEKIFADQEEDVTRVAQKMANLFIKMYDGFSREFGTSAIDLMRMSDLKFHAG